jgi:membrane peptidoglycan carboxypeptidase
VSDADVAQLQRVYGADRFSLRDKAFLAGVHPLELWLAGFLRDNPGAKRSEVIKASADVRQDVYQWLFKTKSPRKQDSRIRRLREEDAFKRVLEEWRGQGYPFTQMVPSFASALGSSGDRPDALARLMGIILNDGIDVPIATVEQLSFAKATPYETHLTYAPDRRPVRVFAPEVAKTLRQALLSVVEGGTAVRIHNAFTNDQNTPLAIGGQPLEDLRPGRRGYQLPQCRSYRDVRLFHRRQDLWNHYSLRAGT